MNITFLHESVRTRNPMHYDALNKIDHHTDPSYIVSLMTLDVLRQYYSTPSCAFRIPYLGSWYVIPYQFLILKSPVGPMAFAINAQYAQRTID